LTLREADLFLHLRLIAFHLISCISVIYCGRAACPLVSGILFNELEQHALFANSILCNELGQRALFVPSMLYNEGSTPFLQPAYMIYVKIK